jgi:hypothetical protein
MVFLEDSSEGNLKILGYLMVGLPNITAENESATLSSHRRDDLGMKILIKLGAALAPSMK